MKHLKSSEEKVKSDLMPNLPDLDRGWAWVVLVASFVAHMFIGASMYAVGIIHIALLGRYRQDISKTAWVGALHSAIIAAGAPLSTILIDKFSCRTALVTSGSLFITGYLATAFAPNIETCIFTCGIIAGCGGATGYTAAIVVIGLNFRRRRNLAMGLSISGVGAGMLFISPLFEVAREHYGNVGFFITLAGINANIIVCGMLCFPSKLELHIQQKRKQNVTYQRQKSHSKLYSDLCFYMNVAIKKPVLCLCFCMFNYGFGIILVFVHLPNYALHKGSSSVQGSLLISICGVTGLLGRILTGVAASHKKLDEIILYTGSIGIVSLASFLFPLYSYSFAGQVIYSGILGMFFGACFVLAGSVNIKFVGVNCMSAALGLELFWFGIGGILGPVVAGMILDLGGTYEQCFIVAGFFVLLACILAVATMFLSTPTKDLNIIDGETEIEIKRQSMCKKDFKPCHIHASGSIQEEVQNCGIHKNEISTEKRCSHSFGSEFVSSVIYSDIATETHTLLEENDLNVQSSGKTSN